MTWLVVGLGNPDRGDDAVGPVVAAGIVGLGLPGVEVVAHEDPTALLDVWSSYAAVVVVDAIFTGAPPGTVVTMEVGARAGVLADRASARTGRGGTHAFGLATAIELGRALGRLPDRLVLVGVEVQQVDHGAGLSSAVGGALDRIQGAVVDLLRQESPPDSALAVHLNPAAAIAPTARVSVDPDLTLAGLVSSRADRVPR